YIQYCTSTDTATTMIYTLSLHDALPILNGADYNDTLVWNTNEDIAVKPFYHAEDLANLPETITSSPSHWHICETIYVADVIKSKDRKSTRLNSSHVKTSYAVFCLKKKRR